MEAFTMLVGTFVQNIKSDEIDGTANVRKPRYLTLNSIEKEYGLDLQQQSAALSGNGQRNKWAREI